MDFLSIIWNVNPEIFSIGSLHIRWYGLLFAVSFLAGYSIFGKFLKLENLKQELLDEMLIYMVIGVVVGARLGHVFFYDWDSYKDTPIDILKIWEGGLASHGAGVGVLITIWIYTNYSVVIRPFKNKFQWKKIKRDQSFLWMMDRVVIVVALSAFFIRFGNLMNSEIYGNPTLTKSGFIYSENLTSDIKESPALENLVEKVSYSHTQNQEIVQEKYQDINLEVEFTKKVRSEEVANKLLSNNIKDLLLQQSRFSEENITIPDNFTFTLEKTPAKTFKAVVPVLAIPRHPTHIYEAVCYLFIFFLLLGIYYMQRGKTKDGMLFGLFCVLVFTARFFIEFIKEVQVARESEMVLNLGQKLSIPFVTIGLILILYSFMNKSRKLEDQS